MKLKLVLVNIIFLLLILSTFISAVNATEFRIGVNTGQELVWKCNLCNTMEMDNIFGNEWNDSGIFNNLSKGKRMKWSINSVELNETFITFYYLQS